MVKIEELNRRIDPEIQVSIDQYASGLLNMIDFLTVELERFMAEENRLRGVVKIYLSNINTTFQKVYVGRTIDDTDVYCRILYLFKPLLISEFKRLTRKRLSKADTCITIIRKIILILKEVKNFQYASEVISLEKIIGRLWDNIRHRAKNDALYYLSLQIKTYMAEGKVGKYAQDSFQFLHPIVEKTVLEGPGERGINVETGKSINL